LAINQALEKVNWTLIYIPEHAMQITIYRSSVKEGLYVYVERKTTLESLPVPVLKQLGEAEKAMDLKLDSNRKL